MHTSSHTIRRLAAAIGLAAALAALAIPAALAGRQSGTPSDGRSPDTHDAALQAQLAAPLDRRSPDTLAMIEAARKRSLNPRLGNSSDTLDPAIAAAITAHQSSPTPSDRRSPDTADAALLAHSPVVTLAKPTGFAWPEFGIGAAATTGAILLLLALRAGLPAARARRELARPAASA